MAKKLGVYSIVASAATSVLIVALFYLFSLQKVSLSTQYVYTDIYAGMVYVFILSMIVSASIWPGIIKRFIKR
jgi:hypothetical protein